MKNLNEFLAKSVAIHTWQTGKYNFQLRIFQDISTGNYSNLGLYCINVNPYEVTEINVYFLECFVKRQNKLEENIKKDVENWMKNNIFSIDNSFKV